VHVARHLAEVQVRLRLCGADLPVGEPAVPQLADIPGVEVQPALLQHDQAEHRVADVVVGLHVADVLARAGQAVAADVQARIRLRARVLRGVAADGPGIGALEPELHVAPAGIAAAAAHVRAGFQRLAERAACAAAQPRAEKPVCGCGIVGQAGERCGGRRPRRADGREVAWLDIRKRRDDRQRHERIVELVERLLACAVSPSGNGSLDLLGVPGHIAAFFRPLSEFLAQQ